jgi:hypothetical protein
MIDLQLWCRIRYIDEFSIVCLSFTGAISYQNIRCIVSNSNPGPRPHSGLVSISLMVTGIPLRDALRSLRADLEQAQSEPGSTLRLQIDAIELELTLELDLEVKAEGKASAEVKFPWLVVGKAEASAGATAQGARTHRVLLTITPLAVAEAAPARSNGTEAGSESPIEGAPIPAPVLSPLIVVDDQARIDRTAT